MLALEDTQTGNAIGVQIADYHLYIQYNRL